MSLKEDFKTFSIADADAVSGVRGLVRTTRRTFKRCWLDRETILKPRVFCQNIGGCGSTYVVQLLRDNGVENAFHEKAPDLEPLAADHYQSPFPTARMVRILRYTRHNVFFEANNRLFAMSKEIARAFPNATFVHLYRDPRDSIQGNMSKPNVEEYARTNSRLKSSLGGPRGGTPFEKFCHHWALGNQRIHEDLIANQQRTGQQFLTLSFDDLVNGRLGKFEKFLGIQMGRQIRPPVNRRETRSEGRYPHFDEWDSAQQKVLLDICGPVFDALEQNSNRESV